MDQSYLNLLKASRKALKTLQDINSGGVRIDTLRSVISEVSELIKAGSDEYAAEEQKLKAAVDAFAAEMKARLLQKLEVGYTGWDNSCSVVNLFAQVRNDLRAVGEAETWTASDIQKLVDIGNRAMFLHYRAKTACPEKASP